MTEVSGYNYEMNVATSRSKVGIRDLKNGLSGYLDRVKAGEEVIVTLPDSVPSTPPMTIWPSLWRRGLFARRPTAPDTSPLLGLPRKGV